MLLPDQDPALSFQLQVTSINPFLASANLEAGCFFLSSFLSSDLNLLRSACELKIPIPTPFPIIGSQVFTNTPLNNYSSSSTKSTSNSLSYGEKLAIGIAIPSTLFLLVVLVILLWYIRDYKRKRSSISNQIPRFPSPPTKPLPIYKPLPPTPPIVPIVKQNRPSPYYPPGPAPTVFHPTPRLSSLPPSSPAPKRSQPRRSRPHEATKLIITHPIHHRPTTPTTRATTSLTTAGPPSSPFPSPPPRSALRGPSRMPPRSRAVVMSEHGGGRRKHRNTNTKNNKGRKERGDSKVSFV